jgi:ribosome-associated toxin RatA of RatAB toxin-antitoxin module
MAGVHKSVLVPYRAKQMYELVDAVESYPEFLPWCGGVQVLERAGERKVVRIDIDFHGVRTYFTTANHNQPPQKITVALRDGPFRRLDGAWKFRALSDAGCKVEFVLHYEFATPALRAVIGPVFEVVTGSFVDAFVKRAESTYAS